MLSVYNVAMVGEFEFVKKSPSNDIIKESRRMQGSLIPLNYQFYLFETTPAKLLRS